jgi:hypothetical protein
MNTLGPLLETVPRTSPLGLRFWDVATGADVGTGLRVTAYPANNPVLRTEAYRTYSGRYAFRGLPGLHAFETGDGSTAFWQNLPPPRPFVIEVKDDARCFQPFQFTALVPGRGLFGWKCPQAGPALSPDGTVPLYSAPARPVPSGLAVVRAELHVAGQDVPAAWATLEATLNGSLLARGLADDQGRVVLLFPYPEPLLLELESPPPGTQRPFTQQSWSLDFTVRYDAPAGPMPRLPDLCQALSQWPAQVEPLASTTLVYGQELVLRGLQNVSPPAVRSVVLVTPAGSPH